MWPEADLTVIAFYSTLEQVKLCWISLKRETLLSSNQFEHLSSTPMIHELSDCQSNQIGDGTRIWQFTVILSGACIGSDCNICSHVFIESDVIIGDRVTIKSGVQIWDNIRIGNDVFIGPNVSFCNDIWPKSRQHPHSYLTTVIEDGASIGSGAVILPGIKIGSNAMIGAGTVVTKDVADNTTVVGNPGREIPSKNQQEN